MTKVTDLPNVGTLTDSDVFPVVDVEGLEGTRGKKVSASQIREYVRSEADALYADKVATEDALAGKLDSNAVSSASVTPTGSSSSRTLGDHLAWPGGRPQLVATRGYLPGTTANAAGVTLTESRATVKFGPSASRDIRLVFAGFYVDGTALGEKDLPQGYTAVAALEKISPNVVRVASVGAKRTISVEAGSGFTITDPIGFDFAAGETAKVQLEQRFAADIGYPANINYSGLIDAYRSSLATGQVGTVGTWAGTSRTQTGNVGFITAIIGVPDKPFPSVAIIGDSIAQNVSDVAGDAYGNHGYIPRGLYDGGPSGVAIPYTNLARAAEKLSTLANGGYANRLTLLQYVSHVICNLGINDISTSTLAQLQANYLTGWSSIKRRNVKLFQCLIGPKTSGTFTDAAGQTISTGFEPGGLRDQINTWISSQVGQGLLDGVINPNPYVEDPANPGKWLPNLTADGLHPNETGHAAMAAAVRAVSVNFTV